MESFRRSNFAGFPGFVRGSGKADCSDSCASFSLRFGNADSNADKNPISNLESNANIYSYTSKNL